MTEIRACFQEDCIYNINKDCELNKINITWNGCCNEEVKKIITNKRY